MIVVVLIFGVCWLPQNVMILWSIIDSSIGEKAHIQHVYLLFYWIAMSNSMYNPIIYCWMNQR
jgi:tachykinin-like receptor